VTFKRFAGSPGSRIVVARRCRVRTGFSFCSNSEKWKLKMLHVASPSRGFTHHSHSPRSTPSPNGEGVQCGVVARGALRRARPRSWPRGSFCLRQQQRHSPHCETHALGRADAPTTGRLEPSGSRQTRGGSCHSPGGGGRRRRGVLASRAAESVGVSARRFTSGAKRRRFSIFLSKSRIYRCMTLIPLQ